jgi:hypothetical protein
LFLQENFGNTTASEPGENAANQPGLETLEPPTQKEVTVITATLIGDDLAQAGDIVCRGRTPVLALCRALVAAGADPDSKLECYRGDVLSLTVKSIGIGAQLTIKEPDHGRIHVARWKAFPASPIEPLIRRKSTAGTDPPPRSTAYAQDPSTPYRAGQ